MSFVAPVTEQRFLLETIARIGEIAGHERFAAATPDMVDAIVEGAGAFAAKHYAPLNRVGDTVGAQWLDGAVTMPAGFREAYRAFVEGGWGSIDVDTEHGGHGLPFCLFTAMFESLGAANMGFSLVNMLTSGAIEALAAHGSPEQQAAWLPRLASGEWTGTMNLTEPQAGSDVGAIKTVAEPIAGGEQAGKWRIRGQKIFITYGEHDLTDNIVHLVLARTPGAPDGTRGISLFLVPKYHLDANGTPAARNDVTCVSIEHKLGIHASPTCVMAFGDSGACIGELVGDLHGGMRAMFTMMNVARLNVGSQGVQIAERALQQASAFAMTRVQSVRNKGGTPVAIVEHPDVRRMLIQMRALTEGARALVYYAAGQVDRAAVGVPGAQERVEILTPLVKAYGADLGCAVASLGIQVHGGMGFIEETGAAQHYRDARIAPIYEGTNGIQAADLVSRKLGLDGGRAFDALIADVRAGAQGEPLLTALADEIAHIAAWMRDDASSDDRLAGSVVFLEMVAVACCGWLMLVGERTLTTSNAGSGWARRKRVTTGYYIDQLVPAALGLSAAARGGAAILYEIDAQTLCELA